MPNYRQSLFTTTLAIVTALAALVGAIGGLIATIYATGGNPPAATPTASPAVSSATPIATATATASPSPTITARPATPTPVVVELRPRADSWWGSPASSGDDGEHGDDEGLVLDWSCAGRGSKRDCGSGMAALQFDLSDLLSDLPEDATLDEAVLTLYADEADDRPANVFMRLVTSEWREDSGDKPECGSSGETAGAGAGDEWVWDVTALVQEKITGDDESVGLCLVLKEDAGVTFGSREGPESGAPTLTLRFR